MSIIYEALKKVEADKKFFNRPQTALNLKPIAQKFKTKRPVSFKTFFLLIVIFMATGLFLLNNPLKSTTDFQPSSVPAQELINSKLAPQEKIAKVNSQIIAQSPSGPDYFLEGIIYYEKNPSAIIN